MPTNRPGWGGHRAGAGRNPTNLHEIIETVPAVETADGVEPERQLTVIDAVVDTIEGMGFLHDAAARVGVVVETVREWRKVGVRANADVTASRRTWSKLSAHEKRCAELATRMAQADATARMRLLDIASGLAVGGAEVVETTTKAVQVNEGDPMITEITTRTSRTLPSPATVTWLLQHRWPADFARNRLELSGPDGGAIPIDTSSARDRITNALDELAANAASTDGHAGATAAAGNGHTPTQ